MKPFVLFIDLVLYTNGVFFPFLGYFSFLFLNNPTCNGHVRILLCKPVLVCGVEIRISNGSSKVYVGAKDRHHATVDVWEESYEEEKCCFLLFFPCLVCYRPIALHGITLTPLRYIL